MPKRKLFFVLLAGFLGGMAVLPAPAGPGPAGAPPRLVLQITVDSLRGDLPGRYDTFVPVIFAGVGLEARKVTRPITPYDVPATRANHLGVKPPSGSIGNPLAEVVGQ